MSKLSKEDLTLWNLYKAKFKNITKKSDLTELKNIDYSEKKKFLLSDRKDFTINENALKLLKKKKIQIEAYIDLHGLNQIKAKL